MNNPGLTAGQAAAGPPAPSRDISANHGPDGRFTCGNTASVVVGQHGRRFWDSVSGAIAAHSAAILADLGHTPDSAPIALETAVRGLAQASALRDSAFERVAEAGGPSTLRGRQRAAFRIWVEASDRVAAHLRLVGLARRERPVDPLEAVRAAVEAANREDETP